MSWYRREHNKSTRSLPLKTFHVEFQVFLFNYFFATNFRLKVCTNVHFQPRIKTIISLSIPIDEGHSDVLRLSYCLHIREEHKIAKKKKRDAN